MKAQAVLDKIDAVLVNAIKWLTFVMLIALTLILTMNIFVRFVPVFVITWQDEIVEMLFAAMVFYGAAAVWILKGHFSAGDWIGKRLKSARAKSALRLLIDLISATFIAIFFRYAINLTALSLELTTILQIPKKVAYSCMPISSGIMLIYSVKFLVLDLIGIIKPKAEPEKKEEVA